MEKLAYTIIKYRSAIVVLTILITLFLGYQIRSIKINSDFVKSLPPNDHTAILYKYIGEKFRGNNIGMIVVEASNIYDPEVIKHIKQITDSIKVTNGVISVNSLTDILYIQSDSSGIEITNLIDEYNLPETKEEIDDLKQRINEKDMYKGSIVSEDGTTAIIMFTLQPEINQQEISKVIKDKVIAMKLPEKIYFGGIPVMMLDISELIIADLFKLIPIIIVVLIIVLSLCFKSLKGVVLPLITVAIASIWTIGLMAIFKYDITLISGNIPVVLFAVGSAYVIHVINHVNEIQEENYKKAIVLSLAYIIIPVFLSALTTIFGFVSFIYGSYLTMIKDFGIFSAIGTGISLILSITFIPALQSFIPKQKLTQHKIVSSTNSFISKYVLKPLHNLLLKHPKYIFTFWIVLILISIFFTFNIERNTNIANYFKKNNPTRISEEILQKKFGGSSPIYILFKGDMQSPTVLKTMLEMENFLKQNPFISYTNSVADLIKELNKAMEGKDKIPDKKNQIEQLWMLLEGQDIMPQLVDDEKKEGIIQSRFASAKTKDIKPFIQSVNNWIKNHPSSEYQIELNGMPSIYNQIDYSILKSQMTSIAIAIILVFLLISIIIKSFKLGLFSIIPILSTIIMLFGFMGITNIPLDIATVLVASVALGIGIDYSVHIINAFNYYKNTTNNIKKIIEQTILINGKGIVINILTVTGGFLVLLFSNIVPIQNFGLLIAICMIFSGLGALTLLPAILILDNNKMKFINHKK
ncbi:MAG TPA: MMPL family transporter [Bacteroidales bacterium]|nr:MMPL family transporter [Bacteroidales bacterium]